VPNYNESSEFGETLKPSSPPPTTTYLTLAKAIEFGEYDSLHLAMFEEWHQLSTHAQFELIKQALRNRTRQLWMQWAEVNNSIDFSKKPHLHQALKNIEQQIKILEQDRERLYVEYSQV